MGMHAVQEAEGTGLLQPGEEKVLGMIKLLSSTT